MLTIGQAQNQASRATRRAYASVIRVFSVGPEGSTSACKGTASAWASTTGAAVPSSAAIAIGSICPSALEVPDISLSFDYPSDHRSSCCESGCAMHRPHSITTAQRNASRVGLLHHGCLYPLSMSKHCVPYSLVSPPPIGEGRRFRSKGNPLRPRLFRSHPTRKTRQTSRRKRKSDIRYPPGRYALACSAPAAFNSNQQEQGCRGQQCPREERID